MRLQTNTRVSLHCYLKLATSQTKTTRLQCKKRQPNIYEPHPAKSANKLMLWGATQRKKWRYFVQREPARIVWHEKQSRQDLWQFKKKDYSAPQEGYSAKKKEHLKINMNVIQQNRTRIFSKCDMHINARAKSAWAGGVGPVCSSNLNLNKGFKLSLHPCGVTTVWESINLCMHAIPS